MHVMLKRAAASAIPALLGLAISPATAMAAMAAPHTSQAAAGPVKDGRQTHERLMRLRLSATHQGHLAATASTAKTTADTDGHNSTSTATSVYPGPAIARFAHFDPGPGTVNKGGAATGVIAYGNYDEIIGCYVYATGGSGLNSSTGGTTGNSVAGTAGNSTNGNVVAATPAQ
jgi:hypothetical protein